MRPGERRGREVADREQFGAQAVVDVVIDIGDVVGQRGDLRLQARPAVERRAASALSKLAIGPGKRRLERAVVLDQPLERFPGQVQPVEIGVAMLQLRDQPQRMGVVVEAADATPSPRSAPPRRHGRTACGRDRAPARRASARSSSSASTRASERAICATSSEWVSRVR